MSGEWSIGNVEIGGPLVLAPLAGHTALPMRVLCRRAGAHLVCSEMIAAQGLAYANRKSLALMATCPEERPIAMQIFGGEPGVMATAAACVEAAGADIIDINMGCPVPKVLKAGAGSALMSDPDRAVAIARAMVGAVSTPVMCKIRAGRFEGDDSFIEMAKALESAGVAAIAIHARTVRQGFTGEADHRLTKRLVDSLDIPVIAGGDVFSPTMPGAILEDTGCAAVMIARGALGRPWIFQQAAAALGELPIPDDPPAASRLGVALCHAQMLALQSDERTAVHEMRGHLAWYTKGLPGSARLRREFNSARTLADLQELMRAFIAASRSPAASSSR